MLDLNLIRSNPEKVAASLAKKGCTADFTELLAWDAERKAKIAEVETLKAKRNKVSAEIPKLKKAGQPVDEIFKEMRELGDEVAKLDKEVSDLADKVNGFIACLPNMPDDDLLAGEKENNKV